MADTLEVAGFTLTKTEWKGRQGRGAEPSPFLPLVQASVDNGYATFSFPMALDGKTDDERKGHLDRVLRLLRKAGGQVDPPVTVMAQTGDIGKDGTVEVTFKTREKIRKATPADDAAAKPAA